MPAKKLPTSDTERLKILNIILKCEKSLKEGDTILSTKELYDFRHFLPLYEKEWVCFEKVLEDESKTSKQYEDLFKTLQLYVSHFIQVLNLSVIRNELKPESRVYYGIEENTLPDLSTETALLEWSERLIKGESERLLQGGTPIYNPTISKLKMYYELFKDSFQNLKIYRQNVVRIQETLDKFRDKANRIILNIWTKVEFKYWNSPSVERKRKYKEYGIQYFLKRENN